MAYLDSIGTKADDKTFKRMKMVLTSAHRQFITGCMKMDISISTHP